MRIVCISDFHSTQGRFSVPDGDVLLHVFGHIHPGYGVVQRGQTTYVNACICNEQNQPSNRAIVVDLTEDVRLSMTRATSPRVLL